MPLRTKSLVTSVALRAERSKSTDEIFGYIRRLTSFSPQSVNCNANGLIFHQLKSNAVGVFSLVPGSKNSLSGVHVLEVLFAELLLHPSEGVDNSLDVTCLDSLHGLV